VLLVDRGGRAVGVPALEIEERGEAHAPTDDVYRALQLFALQAPEQTDRSSRGRSDRKRLCPSPGCFLSGSLSSSRPRLAVATVQKIPERIFGSRESKLKAVLLKSLRYNAPSVEGEFQIGPQQASGSREGASYQGESRLAAAIHASRLILTCSGRRHRSASALFEIVNGREFRVSGVDF
jgi:hypothetical protein